MCSQANLREFHERAGAVRQPEPERRQAVLFDSCHFAEGAAVAIGQERRVVAEAGGAARRPYQGAVGAGLDLFEMIVGPRHAQRGHEMRAALRRRGGAALLQQALDLSHRGGEVLGRAGPARREKIPGAPSSASTTNPESSAKAGSCAAFAAATALIIALARKVSPVSSGSPRQSSPADNASTA